MDDKREFKIDLKADDSDDSPPRDDIFSDTPKQSSKMPVVALLLLLIICLGGTGFMYYHFNKKIRTITSRGSAGIASLSIELNQKFDDLSQQVSDQKKVTDGLISGINTQLGKVNDSITAIKNSKPDKKEMEAAVSGLEQTIAPLQDSIKHYQESLMRLDAETARISTGLKKVETGVLNNTKEINTLDATGVDKQSFEESLKKEREFNQQNMAHAYEALFSEIASLQERIKKLEDAQTKEKSVLKHKPSGENTKSPSGNLSVPKPGEIIEQEIQ